MSSAAPGPRPSQVTIGGWVIAIASAMLVVTVFDAMAKLHSVDTRDALTKALTTGSAKQFGISVDQATSYIRAALFVGGVAAVVTGILGIFVLQRHATARIALTIAAIPVVLTAPVSGGVLGVVIGVATGMLWTRPAREWFGDGPRSPAVARTPTAPARPPAARPDERRVVAWTRPSPGSAEGEDHGPPTATAPPPTPGWGGPPGGPGRPVPPTYPDPLPAAPGQERPLGPWSGYDPRDTVPGPAPRWPGPPTPVRIACVLTWVFTALTGGIYLLLLLAVAADRGEVLTLLRDNQSIQDTGLSDDQLIAVLVAMSAVVLAWCLAAAVLAVLTWRRHTWAWIVLLVSVGAAVGVGLIGLPFSLLNLVACGTTFVLLLQPSVRRWFRSGGSAGPGSPAWPASPMSWPPPGGHEQPLSGPPPGGDLPPSPPAGSPPSGKPPVW